MTAEWVKMSTSETKKRGIHCTVQIKKKKIVMKENRQLKFYYIIIEPAFFIYHFTQTLCLCPKMYVNDLFNN